jgi:predicted HAD superfamily Cof-like phosphohydrolase
MSEIDNVRAFHQKFGQLNPNRITHLTKRKLAERANFMLEELDEFAQASGLEWNGVKYVPAPIDQDMGQQADALVDLCYVLKGTAAMMGLGSAWPDLWDDVQRANMAKVKGPTHRNMGHGADIAKPPGWEGPKTGEILKRHGYDRMAFEDGDGLVDDARCLDDEGAKKMFTKSEE